MDLNHISKHLMLLFNQSITSAIFPTNTISKHLMLLFNTEKFGDEVRKEIFQNISCYCLTNDFTSFFNGLF